MYQQQQQQDDKRKPKTQPKSTTKRKRGRPPKKRLQPQFDDDDELFPESDTDNDSTTDNSNSTEEPTIKRKRGRPRKIKQQEEKESLPSDSDDDDDNDDNSTSPLAKKRQTLKQQQHLEAIVAQRAKRKAQEIEQNAIRAAQRIQKEAERQFQKRQKQAAKQERQIQRKAAKLAAEEERRRKKEMENKERQRKKEIAFDTNFQEMIAKLKAYKEKHGHLELEAGSKLRDWVWTQRRNYRDKQEGKPSCMKQEHVMAFRELGLQITAETFNLSVEQRMDQYIQFVIETGRHPQTNSKDEHEHRLATCAGRWRRRRRLAEQGIKVYKTASANSLPQDRVDKLTEIGFRWEMQRKPRNKPVPQKRPRRIPWEERFERLKAFKEKYGHCEPRNDHKKIGGFVSRQRAEYRLMIQGKRTRMTAERFQKLSELGFRFTADYKNQNLVRFGGRTSKGDDRSRGESSSSDDDGGGEEGEDYDDESNGGFDTEEAKNKQEGGHDANASAVADNRNLVGRTISVTQEQEPPQNGTTGGDCSGGGGTGDLDSTNWTGA